MTPTGTKALRWSLNPILFQGSFSIRFSLFFLVVFFSLRRFPALTESVAKESRLWNDRFGTGEGEDNCGAFPRNGMMDAGILAHKI